MTVASPTVIRPQRIYEIHEVAELTGLAAARLRVWERRYEVVRPQRQAHGYHAYTADQAALLRAFARLIDAEHHARVLRGYGFRIGLDGFGRVPAS